MASRRDELNAYTFAKKRLVAAFLQPSPTGTEEGAPRPLRGILPGMVVGALILAGFGAWGMFKPKAPEGWDKPKEKVIIGSESTTRYVVLKTDGKAQLHPVLNLASAKLLLDPGKGEVVKVDEKVLDNGDIPHGATLGIPYAPDRLPEAGEAGQKKRWAVCERPGEGGRAVQKAAFVLADRDSGKVEGGNRLRAGELIYVQGPDNRLYVVDRQGTKYRVPNDETLLRVLADNRKPQRVSRQWLATLHTGDDIAFPQISGTVGADAGVQGLGSRTNRVGTVIQAPSGNHWQHYVVLRGRVMPITDFMAQLLLSSKQLLPLQQNSQALKANASAFSPTKEYYGKSLTWPDQKAHAVNSANTQSDSRNVACNVLRKVDGKTGKTTLSTWSGTAFPAQLPAGTSSAYVTPGTGQLFRQIKGRSTRSGGMFLVTDTGLRYAMQANADSAHDDSGIGEDKKKKSKEEQQQQEDQNAQRRLGYEKVKPALVPAEWASFLPTGPRLSTGDALQPQGS
ncbi:type VII secretion protein EccB [Streptomyces reniochalinae]|uniref:Type VII secretion protein EccB n=1 Tax=Streptomyces reniochalinae TaxID=2250578 RepID=A0A367EL56_9ACTN|nr:type VII secretion protein EccB [Streptomyces reniochalinae]RCG18365.1 type VII secretion protein EccB [Streptomyces reniochalinae]